MSAGSFNCCCRQCLFWTLNGLGDLELFDLELASTSDAFRCNKKSQKGAHLRHDWHDIVAKQPQATPLRSSYTSEFCSSATLLMCDGGKKWFQTSKSSQVVCMATLTAILFFCFTRRTLWRYWIRSKTHPAPKRTRDVERHQESHEPIFQRSPLLARVSLVMDFLLRAHEISSNSLG